MYLNFGTAYSPHLFSQGSQTVQETLPKVFEKWTVYPFQTVLGAGVDTHVQLGDWQQAPVERWQKK